MEGSRVEVHGISFGSGAFKALLLRAWALRRAKPVMIPGAFALDDRFGFGALAVIAFPEPLPFGALTAVKPPEEP